MRALLLSLLVLVVPACATVAGIHRYVVVDSEPRGKDVQEATTGATVGTTPFFARIENGRQEQWVVDEPEGPRRVEIACQYRWGLSLGGNLAPAVAAGLVAPLIGVGAYAVGNAIDLASGKAWSCPTVAHLGPELPPAEAPALPCRRLVVAPPSASNDALARRIVARYRADVLARGECADVARGREAERLFLRFGATYTSGYQVEEFRREQLTEIAVRAGATHLAVLELVPGEGEVTVSPTIHELARLSLRHDPPFVVRVAAEEVRGRSTWDAVARAVTLVPNSVAFSGTANAWGFVGTGAARVVDEAAPPLSWTDALDNFSIGYEVDPDARAPWSLVPRLTPGAAISGVDRVLTIASPGSTRTAHVEVRAIAAGFGPSVTLVLPLGQISAGVALGGSRTSAREPGEEFEARWQVVAQGRVAYTFFLSEHFFTRVRVSAAWTPGTFVARHEYAADSSASVTVAVGVFLPQVAARVDEWLE